MPVNQVVVKQEGQFTNLFLLDVPVHFAKVHEPQKKYQSEDRAYQVTAFVDDEVREYLEDVVKINKQLFKVGKDKTKKREIKYKLSSQLGENEKFHYDDVEGLNGISLTLNEFTKKGKLAALTVIDADRQPFTEDIGNGSKLTIKLFGYRNQDDLLVVALNTVQVKEHVPYEGGSSGVVNEDVFGGEYTVAVAKEVSPETTATAQQTTSAPSSAKVESASEDEFDEFDEDDPF